MGRKLKEMMTLKEMISSPGWYTIDLWPSAINTKFSFPIVRQPWHWWFCLSIRDLARQWMSTVPTLRDTLECEICGSCLDNTSLCVTLQRCCEERSADLQFSLYPPPSPLPLFRNARVMYGRDEVRLVHSTVQERLPSTSPCLIDVLWAVRSGERRTAALMIERGEERTSGLSSNVTGRISLADISGLCVSEVESNKWEAAHYWNPLTCVFHKQLWSARWSNIMG